MSSGIIIKSLAQQQPLGLHAAPLDADTLGGGSRTRHLSQFAGSFCFAERWSSKCCAMADEQQRGQHRKQKQPQQDEDLQQQRELLMQQQNQQEQQDYRCLQQRGD
ncbi:hypothetical protein Efla_007318 [Eimeria flavescens]